MLHTMAKIQGCSGAHTHQGFRGSEAIRTYSHHTLDSRENTKIFSEPAIDYTAILHTSEEGLDFMTSGTVNEVGCLGVVINITGSIPKGLYLVIDDPAIPPPLLQTRGFQTFFFEAPFGMTNFFQGPLDQNRSTSVV